VVVFALLLATTLGLLAATLPVDQRAQVWGAVEPNVALVVMVWFFASLAGGLLTHKAWFRFAAAPGRLAERVRVLLSADPARSVTAPGQDDGGLALLDAGAGASEGSIALTAAGYPAKALF
jgi:hypothetical protein